MKRLHWLIVYMGLTLLFQGCLTSLEESEILPLEFQASNMSGEWWLSDILLLVSDNSELTLAEKTKLKVTLVQLDEKYPALKNLLQTFFRDTGPLIFKMDPSLEGEGMYDIETGIITFRSVGCITLVSVLEELLHVVQHRVVYRNELREDRNYMGKSKRNIEYEALVFQDVMSFFASQRDGEVTFNYRGGNGSNDDEYKSWLFSLMMENLRNIALVKFNGKAEDFLKFWK